MAEFKWYLNRQGVRGPRGDKGEKGFSPIITEKTNTSTEYVLHVQNEQESESFDTPNLKEGLVPEDLGGTVVRYNRTDGKQYYGEIDNATEEVAGLVKLTKEDEVLNPTSEVSVLTAQEAKDNYATLDGLADTNLQIEKNIQNIETLQTTVQTIQSGNVVRDVTQPTDDTLRINYTDLKGGSPASKDIKLKTAVDITASAPINIDAQNNITIAVDNQTIQIVDGKLHANTDELGNEVNELSGRVTANEANIVTLNTEMTDVTGNIETLQTTVNGQVTDINILKTSMQNKQNKLVAGDNITLTNNSDGTTTVASTGGIAELPIATEQTLGGIKVGDGLAITEEGVLSATGGGGGITTLDFIDGGDSRTTSTVVTLFSAGSNSTTVGNNETNVEIKEVL